MLRVGSTAETEEAMAEEEDAAVVEKARTKVRVRVKEARSAGFRKKERVSIHKLLVVEEGKTGEPARQRQERRGRSLEVVASSAVRNLSPCLLCAVHLPLILLLPCSRVFHTVVLFYP